MTRVQLAIVREQQIRVSVDRAQRVDDRRWLFEGRRVRDEHLLEQLGVRNLELQRRPEEKRVDAPLRDVHGDGALEWVGGAQGCDAPRQVANEWHESRARHCARGREV